MLDRAEASKTQEDLESEREIRRWRGGCVVNSMQEVTYVESTDTQCSETRACEMETVKVHLTELKGVKFQQRNEDLNRQERQPHRSQQQQPVQEGRVEKGKDKQEEEGKVMEKEGMKEKEKGKEERQDGKEGTERGVEKVAEKDVMDGRSRNSRRRRSREEGEVLEEKETFASAYRTDQIFVKMDGCKTLPLEVSPNDKVGDILRRRQSSARDSKQDMHVTREGRVLRKDDELKSGGVRDGSTVQVVRRMRGGGRNKGKMPCRERRKPAKKAEQSDQNTTEKSSPEVDAAFEMVEAMVEMDDE